MEYRRLGHSGLWVSPICLGTMMFGDQTLKDTAERIVDAGRDAGVNFIDTADAYSLGAAERIVGELIRKDRDRWVLATKVANPMVRMREDPNMRGLGRKWLHRAIDDSLDRLDTDYVDIYYLHHDDPVTPLEETLGAMDDLIAAGKVRYWGLSNYAGWRIAELVRVAESLGMARPIVCQPYYNAMNRMPEVEILPACAHYGIGVVPYSPLARGVLTGKYRPDAEPEDGSRAGRGDKRMMQTEFRAESLVLAQRFKQRAEERGMSAGQFALNWVLNSSPVSAAVAGPRTEEQWADYLGAVDHTFTAEDEEFVDSLVPAGHPSTPGYTDPRFPVEGRQPRTGG